VNISQGSECVDMFEVGAVIHETAANSLLRLQVKKFVKIRQG